MGATLGQLFDDYRTLIETCRARADELSLSRAEIDRLAGLPSGYSGKLLGNGHAKKQRRVWPIGLSAILGTLGLKVLLVEDQDATARTLALRVPVDCSNQRFGNGCNVPALKIKNVEADTVAIPQRNDPPSHAHLRVIQGKRRGSKYR